MVGVAANALVAGWNLMCVIGASAENLDYDLLFCNTFLNVFQPRPFIRSMDKAKGD